MKPAPEAMTDLNFTTQYWFTVADLARRYHLGVQMVRLMLKPHRGRCHRARRGKHPRLVLWIPIEVVRQLDRERREMASGGTRAEPCQDPPTDPTDTDNSPL